MAIVCAVVASAGAIKLLDLPLFHRVLSQYQVLPPAVAALAAPIVPALELGLCVLWLLGLRTRRVDWSILLLLILVAGTYAVEWSMAGSKSCGCFGRAGPAWLDSGFGAMSKAAVLVGLQAAGMKLRSGGRVLAQPSAETKCTTPSRAFTLVEVLVCIAVLAVLVALAIPMVGRAAAASRDAKSLANLRTHAQTMLAYTADSRGLFPCFVPPVPAGITLHDPRSNFAWTVRYFDQCLFWNFALADGYYGGRHDDPSFRAPNAPPAARAERFVVTDYLYPCSFVAAPEFYDPTTRTIPPEQFRATALHEVRFPANKALLSARYPWSDQPPGKPQPPAHGAFVDGHARAVGPEDIQPNAPGEPYWGTWLTLNDHILAMMHCQNGVRGFDRAFGGR